MGRELQKKKNRSSIPKLKHKPKSRRVNPRSNPIVAANWDQSLTLSQNYQRLGLTSKLNARAGGVEKLLTQVPDSRNLAEPPQDSLVISSKTPKTVTPSEVQIERDPGTGAILRVIRSASELSNPLSDPLNEIAGSKETCDVKEQEPHGIVKSLEEQASLGIKSRPRHQSSREQQWLSDLADKYGDDYGRMCRDRKLNPFQQTEKDIRHRMKRWRETQA